jgi:hypothetical protein
MSRSIINLFQVAMANELLYELVNVSLQSFYDLGL